MSASRATLLLVIVAIFFTSSPALGSNVSTPWHARHADVLDSGQMPLPDTRHSPTPAPELVGFTRAMSLAEAPHAAVLKDYLWPTIFGGVTTKVAKAVGTAVTKSAKKVANGAKNVVTHVGRALANGITAAKNTSAVKAVGTGLATGAAFEVGKRVASHALDDRPED